MTNKTLTPANADLEAAKALIAKLDNKQLTELGVSIKTRRAENIKENKRIAAEKKAKAEAKRAEKAAAIKAEAAPLTELVGTAQDTLFAERVAKTKRPVLAWLCSQYNVEVKGMKVADLRKEAIELFAVLEADASRNAKAA